MTKTVTALFDGQALWPEEPINIEPNTRVTLTVLWPRKGAVIRGQSKVS